MDSVRLRFGERGGLCHLDRFHVLWGLFMNTMAGNENLEVPANLRGLRFKAKSVRQG